MVEEDKCFYFIINNMKRIFIILVLITSCTKGELPKPNGSAFQPIIDYNSQQQSIPVEEKYFNLTVNAVRSPAQNTANNIYQYYTSVDFNNHPGYDQNRMGGWVNLEYNSSSNITRWGFINIDLSLLSGSDVTISSTPAEGYYFSSWSNGSKENSLTFKLTSDVNISAIFKIKD